nr:hypothetical protein [Tanacetum cinerariifolium]
PRARGPGRGLRDGRFAGRRATPGGLCGRPEHLRPPQSGANSLIIQSSILQLVMANFDKAYQIVHGNEGGYANVVNDKGGETYAGIARHWHNDWPGWVLVDTWKAAHGTPKRGAYIEMPGLVDEVVGFYRERWDNIMGDQIKSQPIANQLYDFATGTGIAVKIAQRVLVGMGYYVGKSGPDNVFGPSTLAALNAANESTFYTRLKAARIDYYHYLVAQDASQGVHLAGWLARANRFLDIQKKTSGASS